MSLLLAERWGNFAERHSRFYKHARASGAQAGNNFSPFLFIRVHPWLKFRPAFSSLRLRFSLGSLLFPPVKYFPSKSAFIGVYLRSMIGRVLPDVAIKFGPLPTPATSAATNSNPTPTTNAS